MRCDPHLVELLLVRRSRLRSIVGHEYDTLFFGNTPIRHQTQSMTKTNSLKARSVSSNLMAPSMGLSPCHKTPSQSNIQVSCASRRSLYDAGEELERRVKAGIVEGLDSEVVDVDDDGGQCASVRIPGCRFRGNNVYYDCACWCPHCAENS